MCVYVCVDFNTFNSMYLPLQRRCTAWTFTSLWILLCQAALRIISKSKPISKIRRTNTRWDLIEQQRQRRFESSNRCIKLTPIRRDGISRIRVIPLYMNCFDWISFMPSHNHCNLVAGVLNNVIQAGIHDMIRRIELLRRQWRARNWRCMDRRHFPRLILWSHHMPCHRPFHYTNTLPRIVNLVRLHDASRRQAECRTDRANGRRPFRKLLLLEIFRIGGFGLAYSIHSRSWNERSVRSMCTVPQSISNHLVCTHVSLIVSEVNMYARRRRRRRFSRGWLLECHVSYAMASFR